jgi:hypothetical protein
MILKVMYEADLSVSVVQYHSELDRTSYDTKGKTHCDTVPQIQIGLLHTLPLVSWLVLSNPLRYCTTDTDSSASYITFIMYEEFEDTKGR